MKVKTRELKEFLGSLVYTFNSRGPYCVSGVLGARRDKNAPKIRVYRGHVLSITCYQSRVTDHVAWVPNLRTCSIEKEAHPSGEFLEVPNAITVSNYK